MTVEKYNGGLEVDLGTDAAVEDVAVFLTMKMRLC